MSIHFISAMEDTDMLWTENLINEKHMQKKLLIYNVQWKNSYEIWKTAIEATNPKF